MPQIYKTDAGRKAILQWYEAALQSLDVPFQECDVPTRFGNTHLLALGDPAAPPLVLVPGYGGSAPLWHKQLADFAAHHRVYALDMVGMPGKSAPTPLSLLNDDYTNWLLDVLNALNLAQPDVAGVCLGGWVVTRLGIDAPHRIRKAVLLTPVGLARFKVYIRSGVPLILNMGDEAKAERYGRRLLLHAFTPPGSNLQFDRQLAKAMMLTIKHFDVGVAAGLLGERPRYQELWTALRVLMRFVRSESLAELKKFNVPAMLFVGEHEAIYNPYTAVRRAKQAMPNLIAEVVPGTGHAAIFDRPDYVNPRIIDFLKA
jgi:pimeloyl-ACP methyl ester carboxylesterase